MDNPYKAPTPLERVVGLVLLTGTGTLAAAATLGTSLPLLLAGVGTSIVGISVIASVDNKAWRRLAGKIGQLGKGVIGKKAEGGGAVRTALGGSVVLACLIGSVATFLNNLGPSGVGGEPFFYVDTASEVARMFFTKGSSLFPSFIPTVPAVYPILGSLLGAAVTASHLLRTTWYSLPNSEPDMP